MPDDLESGGPQKVVLGVGQSLTGGNDDGLACVNTQGVDILHVAHLLNTNITSFNRC